MIVYFSTKAEKDITEIEEWLTQQGTHLPDKFHSELFEVIELIRLHPLTGLQLKDKSRLFRMDKFRYFLICDIFEKNIVVLHVVHQHRHPKLRYSRIK